MRRHYFVRQADIDPRVFLRLTDNWIELTLRFLVDAYGVRLAKDAMSREILTEFEAAGIGIASGTFELAGLPPVRVSAVLEKRSELPPDADEVIE